MTSEYAGAVALQGVPDVAVEVVVTGEEKTSGFGKCN